MLTRRPLSLLFPTLLLLAAAVAAAWSVGHLDNAAWANPQVSPDDDPSWGPIDAPVTIIEFSDYPCPYCKRFHDETLPQIQATYEGRVRFVYRDFPLTAIHPDAQKAAEASECADDQGRFWEYHELLWVNQQELDVPNLKAYAGEIGLDTVTFDNCLDTGKNAQEVEKDYSDGISYGVQGTPWFFINDVELGGAQPFSNFQSVIDSFLPAARTVTIPVGSWANFAWTGDSTPQTVADCFGAGNVAVMYRLDAATQTFQRWIRGRDDLSNMTDVFSYHPLLALNTSAQPATCNMPMPQGGPGVISTIIPAGGWFNFTTSDVNASAEEAAETCGDGNIAVMYRLDATTQTFQRWVRGRPDVSNMTDVQPFDALLALNASDQPANCSFPIILG